MNVYNYVFFLNPHTDLWYAIPRELITMHRNILYPHKEMEKEQIMKAFLDGKVNYRKDWADQYYNKTYNK